MWRVIILIPSLLLFCLCVDWMMYILRDLLSSDLPADEHMKPMFCLFFLCSCLYFIIAIMCIHGLWA